MRYVAFMPLSLLAASMLIGCASSPPMPVAEFARAQTLVQQAERNQAQRFAAMELGSAKEKLYQAKTAMDKKKPKLAYQYASEAALDAELALARSSSAQAEKAAAELSASIDELREESQRNLTGP